MKKLLLPFLCLGFLACQPKEDLPMDVAARASGKYIIRSYVVDGDTLYSANGINKLGVTNFFIQVDRKAPDTVGVTYTQNWSTLPIINGSGVVSSATRLVYVEEKSGKFQFLENAKAPFIYESSVEGSRFYERTVGYNVDSLYARWLLDSLKSPYSPPLREIIITAQK